MADLAMNRIRFSAFAFSEENLAKYWQRCLHWRPDYLYGYVSMLTEFARFVSDRGSKGSKLGLKVVVTTAEALTGPQRVLLEETFEAPVQNEYGCGEVGPIAYECPEGKLHVMSQNVFVEIVGEDGSPVKPGETGRVVVTDLNNRAMPLIRYEIGDRAIRGERCSCGRGFPVLEQVLGREYDFVCDAEGRRYHGEYFMYLFEDLRDRGGRVDQFRVTQVSERELVIEVDVPRSLEETEEEFLKERIHQDMPSMEIRLEYVESIEALDSGKTRVVRNLWMSGTCDGDSRE